MSIISVVLFHAGVPYFTGGFAGVDIFFVISGYLIGSMLLKEIGAGSFTFKRFYARRAKRILPPLFLVLSFSLIVALFFLSPVELNRFVGYSAATVLSASNFVLTRSADYFVANTEINPLVMTWSLAVEEQFYIFFPFLLLAIRNQKIKAQTLIICVISIASLLLSIWATRRYPLFAFYLLPTRAWELGAGVLLVQCELLGFTPRRQLISNLLSLLGISLIVFAILSYGKTTAFPGYAALAPVLGAVLLIYSRNGWINRCLALKPMVGIGLVSYSWYLWHWPLLAFSRCFANQEIPVSTAMLLIVAALVLAILTYYLVEKPFRRSTSPSVSLLRRYATVAMVAVLCDALIFAAHGLPFRYSDSLAAFEREIATLESDDCLVGYGASDLTTRMQCRPTVERAKYLVVYGDSHAAAIAPALKLKARSAGEGFIQLTKSSCPPLTGVSRYMPNHPSHLMECARFNANALASITNNGHIDTVVLAGFWSIPFSEGSYRKVGDDAFPQSLAENQANFRYGLQQTIAALRDSGKHVVVLNDAPYLPLDPVRTVLAQLIPGRQRLGEWLGGVDMDASRGVNRAEATANDAFVDAEIAKATRGIDGVTSFSLKNGLCDTFTCHYVNGDQIYYVDRQHLSVSGAIHATSLLEWPGIRLASRR